jgi:hypothetical protein
MPKGPELWNTTRGARRCAVLQVLLECIFRLVEGQAGTGSFDSFGLRLSPSRHTFSLRSP